MKIKHSIYDTDTHFSVDVVTRELKNEGTPKNTLIKGDHNSERFTFQFPRFIEGHDMSKCDHVQVHFNNIDVMTKAESRGVYEVDDLQISPDGDEVVICSWLISGTATKYVGALGFLVRFSCVENDGKVFYVWNTAIYSKTAVSDGIYNGEAVVEEYADILAGWEAELKANQIVSIEQTTEGEEDGGVNVWTATFGDGRTSDFHVKNGKRGPTGLIGSIETIDGQPLHFFVGTQAQYAELTEEQKANLFAIITDDPMADNMISALNTVNAFINGTQSVKNADYATRAGTAANAENADEATHAGSATSANGALTAKQVLYNGNYVDPVDVVVKKATSAETDQNGVTIRANYFTRSWQLSSTTGKINLPTNPSTTGYYYLIREDDSGVFDFGFIRYIAGKAYQRIVHTGLDAGAYYTINISSAGELSVTGFAIGAGSNPKLILTRCCMV